MTTAWLSLATIWRPVLLTLLVFTAICGLIAVLSPRWFSRLASLGSQWVDSQRYVRWLDARIDIDHVVLRHARAFGICVLAALFFATVQWIAWRMN